MIKRIWVSIIRLWRESLLLLLSFTLLATISSLFIRVNETSNQLIESTLDNLVVNYTIQQNTKDSDQNLLYSNSTLYSVDFLGLVDDISELCMKNVIMCNYSLRMMFDSNDLSYEYFENWGEFFEDDTIRSKIPVYGIKSSRFFEKNNIKIEVGENGSVEEINNGMNVAIVPIDLLQNKNGIPYNISIGDIITLEIPNFTILDEVANSENKDKIELEVIGLYDFDSQKKYLKENPMRYIEDKPIFISEQIIKNISKQYIVDNQLENRVCTEDGCKLKMNTLPMMVDIQLSLSNTTNVNGFENKVRNLVQEKNNEYNSLLNTQKEYFSIETNTKQIQSIIQPIKMMRNIYLNVFICVVGMTSMVVFFVILFSMKRREKEMRLFYLLGENKSRTGIYVVFQYCVIAIVALILSGIFGNLLHKQIINQMIESNSQKQREIVRLIDNQQINNKIVENKNNTRYLIDDKAIENNIKVSIFVITSVIIYIAIGSITIQKRK